MISKSMASALDFDAKVVSHKKLEPLAKTLEANIREICEKLTERPLQDDDYETTEPGRHGNPSGHLVAGNII